VIFGTNVVIRHPKRISLDDGVVVSDGCVLDAGGGDDGGDGAGHELSVGKGVILGQNTMLRCKGGTIRIGANVGFGANSAVYGGDGNTIEIGENGLIAPYVYIGSGRYHFDRTDIPIVEQGPAPLGGNRIGAGVWMGLRATVIDGADVGRDAIISAGAVVTESLPAYSIAAGTPARVIRYREATGSDASATA
jgi:acetyltransferase-like isoleucine patch superfamily enzyme